MKIISKINKLFSLFDINYVRYWNSRYREGGTSGYGSYGKLAELKAQIINTFIKENNIHSIIEFGCGDGNQLKYMEYPKYFGMDVSEKSISMCLDMFHDDSTKSFMVYSPRYFRNNKILSCDLVVCLDVLYHIIDECDFVKTLDDIFSCSTRYIILYSNLHEYEPYRRGSHIRYRELKPYLEKYSDFKIKKVTEQPFEGESRADFIFIEERNLD